MCGVKRAKIYRVISVAFNPLVYENVGMITSLPAKRISVISRWKKISEYYPRDGGESQLASKLRHSPYVYKKYGACPTARWFEWVWLSNPTCSDVKIHEILFPGKLRGNSHILNFRRNFLVASRQASPFLLVFFVTSFEYCATYKQQRKISMKSVRAEWLQSLSSSKTDSRCIKMTTSFNDTINKRSKSMYTSFCES